MNNPIKDIVSEQEYKEIATMVALGNTVRAGIKLHNYAKKSLQLEAKDSLDIIRNNQDMLAADGKENPDATIVEYFKQRDIEKKHGLETLSKKIRDFSQYELLEYVRIFFGPITNSTEKLVVSELVRRLEEKENPAE